MQETNSSSTVDDDRIPRSKKYGDDRKPPKDPETRHIDEDRILSIICEYENESARQWKRG